ncbi:unnamed protein product, partial [Iphiclides podalirius]
MNFAKLFSFALAFLLALSCVTGAPSPRWNPFKKLEKVGQNIRDGIIKAGPAVGVVGQAASIIKPGK